VIQVRDLLTEVMEPDSVASALAMAQVRSFPQVCCMRLNNGELSRVDVYRVLRTSLRRPPPRMPWSLKSFVTPGATFAPQWPHRLPAPIKTRYVWCKWVVVKRLPR